MDIHFKGCWAPRRESEGIQVEICKQKGFIACISMPSRMLSTHHQETRPLSLFYIGSEDKKFSTIGCVKKKKGKEILPHAQLFCAGFWTRFVCHPPAQQWLQVQREGVQNGSGWKFLPTEPYGHKQITLWAAFINNFQICSSWSVGSFKTWLMYFLQPWKGGIGWNPNYTTRFSGLTK